MGTKGRKPTPPHDERPQQMGEDLPEHWSAQRKTELVPRLLRGEAIDAVSRESQVPAHELESWKRVLLETGARRLRSRAEPEERELMLARASALLAVIEFIPNAHLVAPDDNPAVPFRLKPEKVG